MSHHASECTSFEALYDYNPAERGDIALNIGDICYVQNPINANNDPQGWLEGLNFNTGEHGRFPGTFCRLLDNHAQIPLPPRPPSRDILGEKPSADSKPNIVNDHIIEKRHFTKPVWCNNCNSYIWGGDQIAVFCTVCHLTTHLCCASLFGNLDFPCDATKEYLSDINIEDISKNVDDWSCDDVIEWVAASHMQPYMQCFRSNGITGSMLKNITERDLHNYGIKIALHAKLVKLSIEELLKPPPSESTLLNTKINFLPNDVLSTHEKLLEHTFTTIQVCDVCNRFMFGIFRQGVMCADCSTQCHSHCANGGLQACYGTHQQNRRPSDSEDPSFCCNFLSSSIPPVMLKCVTRVEEAGLDWPNIYDYDVVYDKCRDLRSACNQDIDQVNMRDPSWSEPDCAAFVLKSFLLELPDPLLDLYDEFIELTDRSNYTLKDVRSLLEQQSDYNKSQLQFIVCHCVKISKYSRRNYMTISKLASIFSILLVRPPENEARKYVTNWKKHELIVELLLLACSNNEKPTWLWEEATRLDAQSCLYDAPDGGYLVRSSQERRGQYTLVVKDNDRDRLIRIINNNGLYGFNAESASFHSLQDLIEHFQVHSLKQYNHELDIKLMYPYGKPDESQLSMASNEAEEVKLQYDQVDKRLKEIKLLEYEKEDKLNLLEECKAMSESQTDIVRFLEEQLSLAQQQYHEATSRDKQDISLSLKALNDLLIAEKQSWSELDNQLSRLQREYNMLNTKFTELSPEIPALEEEYNTLHRKIKKIDEKAAHALEIEDWKGIYDDPSVLRNERTRIYEPRAEIIQEGDNTGELEERDWLGIGFSREGADRLLSGKPNGTFVVRKSERYPYVISLVYEGNVKHVPVLAGPNGYGFAEPHNIYKTLHELINHYHHQSLRMHNRELDTTLRIPYGLLDQRESEPIYC